MAIEKPSIEVHRTEGEPKGWMSIDLGYFKVGTIGLTYDEAEGKVHRGNEGMGIRPTPVSNQRYWFEKAMYEAMCDRFDEIAQFLRGEITEVSPEPWRPTAWGGQTLLIPLQFITLYDVGHHHGYPTPPGVHVSIMLGYWFLGHNHLVYDGSTVALQSPHFPEGGIITEVINEMLERPDLRSLVKQQFKSDDLNQHNQHFMEVEPGFWPNTTPEPVTFSDDITVINQYW